MSAVSDDITADLIIEAQEILDRLGEQLVSLEQAPQDTEQLNAVFRGYHTLKGGAGFLGVTAMVELCHAAEEALGIARAGQAVLQAHHFDAAQQSLDYLQSMLDAVSSGTEPGYAPPDLIAQFDVHGGAAAPAAAAAAPAAGAGDLITDDEFEALLDHVALYPGRVDHCTVDGEVVQPQPGSFYGGWITSDLVGPFKGIPGSMGW